MELISTEKAENLKYIFETEKIRKFEILATIIHGKE